MKISPIHQANRHPIERKARLKLLPSNHAITSGPSDTTQLLAQTIETTRHSAETQGGADTTNNPAASPKHRAK
jgi:hypothetical protein